MTPKLYLRKGAGWHQVLDVEDVRIQAGKIVLENGQEVNGDICAIIMNYNRGCDGQTVIKKLLEMEPRILDMRLEGANVDMSVILCGDDVDPANPRRWIALGRVMGIRPIGQDPEWRGAGGNVVAIPEGEG